MQGAKEMITISYQWWGWLLFLFFLIPVVQLAGWCGDKLGHASYRAWRRWRDRKITQPVYDDTPPF